MKNILAKAILAFLIAIGGGIVGASVYAIMYHEIGIQGNK